MAKDLNRDAEDQQPPASDPPRRQGQNEANTMPSRRSNEALSRTPRPLEQAEAAATPNRRFLGTRVKDDAAPTVVRDAVPSAEQPLLRGAVPSAEQPLVQGGRLGAKHLDARSQEPLIHGDRLEVPALLPDHRAELRARLEGLKGPRDGTGEIVESVRDGKKFKPEERPAAELLASEGHTVKALRPIGSSKRRIEGMGTPDASVDGVPTELKNLTTKNPDSLKRHLNEAANKQRAMFVMVDLRNSEMSREDGRKGFEGFRKKNPDWYGLVRLEFRDSPDYYS